MDDPRGVAPGARFADTYEIVRPLARGGMGAVYVARDLSAGRDVALKLMHPESVSDPALRSRFAREARVAAQIDSPHVVTVYAAGVDAATGAPWIAMELLEGRDLAAYIADRGALSPALAAVVARQLGHCLGAAHRAGVVHRDLKPDNVFLVDRPGGELFVKVLDFGIARLLGAGSYPRDDERHRLAPVDGAGADRRPHAHHPRHRRVGPRPGDVSCPHRQVLLAYAVPARGGHPPPHARDSPRAAARSLRARRRVGRDGAAPAGLRRVVCPRRAPRPRRPLRRRPRRGGGAAALLAAAPVTGAAPVVAAAPAVLPATAEMPRVATAPGPRPPPAAPIAAPASPSTVAMPALAVAVPPMPAYGATQGALSYTAAPAHPLAVTAAHPPPAPVAAPSRGGHGKTVGAVAGLVVVVASATAWWTWHHDTPVSHADPAHHGAVIDPTPSVASRDPRAPQAPALAPLPAAVAPGEPAPADPTQRPRGVRDPANPGVPGVPAPGVPAPPAAPAPIVLPAPGAPTPPAPTPPEPPPGTPPAPTPPPVTPPPVAPPGPPPVAPPGPPAPTPPVPTPPAPTPPPPAPPAPTPPTPAPSAPPAPPTPPAPAPPTPPAAQDGCGERTTCSRCVMGVGCGWCDSAHRCVSNEGATCRDALVTRSGQCAAGNAEYSHLRTCRACVNELGARWCPSTQRCLEGNSHEARSCRGSVLFESDCP